MTKQRETPYAGGGVLTFGEAIVGYASGEGDLAGSTTFTRFLGGADLNVAVALVRLGVPATWAGVLGDDAHGDYASAQVAGLGVGALVHRAPGPTAVMFKAGVGGEDPEVLQLRRGSAFAQDAGRVLTDAVDALARVDHLHLTGITLGVSEVAHAATIALLDAARAAGRTVSFDPNLRPHLWSDPDEMREVVNAVAARADVVLPGVGEGRLLTGTDDPEGIVDFYRELGSGGVVVKLGAAGALGVDGGGAVVRSRTYAVDVVDTVGAGDGFAAGYLAGLLGGEAFADRLDRAAAVGALVTTRPGDLDAMPSRAEVDLLLATAAAGPRPT
ncbi:sugar kinase [Microlunatus spumicola]|uniref:Sugar kinase n=1 Tax=Microlunatus spumicola TaxID=81499 RepID=A0ABP6Y421_9ACTN